jgi:hypothetical protein
LGLLDNLIGTGIDDPRFAATTQLAQGLLSSPRLMQGLAQGVGGYQQAIAQARAQKAQEEERQMRLQMQQLQMQQAQAQAEKQKKLEALAGQFARTPQQMALGAEGKGPTASALQASQGMSPGFDFAGYAQGLAGIDPMAALTMQGALRKEVKDPVKLAAGEGLFEPGTGRLIVNNPKAPDMPSAVREYQFAQDQGYKGTFQQFQLEQKRAGATSLNVNTGERIPTALVKEQDAMVDRVFNASAINADLSVIEGQIASGKLEFGPVANATSTARNMLGISTEQSRAYASFRTTLEKLRNDSLRLNTGVQTDGDAQREWNALFQNINDTKYVQERLGEIRKINQRAGVLQRQRLNILRKNSGAAPLDLPEVAPAIGGSGDLSPAEQQELQQLRARLGK